MGEWTEYSLKDIAKFSQGIQIPLEDQKTEPFEGCARFIRIVDFTKENSNDIRYINNPGNRYIVNEDDLVMIRYGSQTAGKIARGFNGAIANNTFKILPDKNILDKNFLFFYLSQKSIFEHFHFAQASSTMPAITFDMIGDLIINVPQVHEQRVIASILSSLDDKIDLLHRQNKTLEALAETLFRQWFVEEADESWEMGKLSDLIELVYGKGLKEEIRTGIGFPVVGSSGVVGYHSEYFVEGPGIVIGRKGTLGKVIYLFENFFPIDTTYFVKSKLNFDGLFYEYFLLLTLNFEEMNSDSAVPGLNRDIALSTEIKIPSEVRIKEFNIVCSNLFSKINSNTKQVASLTQLRDTLIPKLMSGEIRVKN